MNASKEKMEGDQYLDTIPIYRFTLKCPNCASNILLKTDPANSSYVLECIESNLPTADPTPTDRELPPSVCIKHENSDALESLQLYEDNNVQ